MTDLLHPRPDNYKCTAGRRTSWSNETGWNGPVPDPTRGLNRPLLVPGPVPSRRTVGTLLLPREVDGRESSQKNPNNFLRPWEQPLTHRPPPPDDRYLETERVRQGEEGPGGPPGNIIRLIFVLKFFFFFKVGEGDGTENSLLFPSVVEPTSPFWGVCRRGPECPPASGPSVKDFVRGVRGGRVGGEGRKDWSS